MTTAGSVEPDLAQLDVELSEEKNPSIHEKEVAEATLRVKGATGVWLATLRAWVQDDSADLGQTMAAHDLCTDLPPYMRAHHLQAGVGHYGVFAGRRWDSQIYPQVRNFIQAHN